MTKRTHPPFDAWLLSEEPLTLQQSVDLQEHIRICESCQQLEAAWSQVERVVHNAGIVAPTPGFSLRWLARLESHRARQHRRQSWIVFLGIAALALLTMATLVGVMVALWQSPAQFLFGLLYRMALILEMLGSFGFYMGDLIQALPGFSWIGLFFFTGFTTMFGVLWLVAYQQLTAARRFVR